MTKTNLQLMLEAEEGLTLENKRKMGDYLVGALSALVDEKIWRRALDAAVQDHKRRQEMSR